MLTKNLINKALTAISMGIAIAIIITSTVSLAIIAAALENLR